MKTSEISDTSMAKMFTAAKMRIIKNEIRHFQLNIEYFITRISALKEISIYIIKWESPEIINSKLRR